MARSHIRRRRLGGLVTLVLAMAAVAPVSAWAATTVQLHQPHVDTLADCGSQGILWHFVLNKLEAGTPSGTLTATFDSAGTLTGAGASVGAGKVQHFWVETASTDTLLRASASVSDQTGSPMLVLSHWECGEVIPNTPASNPPSTPPSAPPSNVPEGGLGGGSGTVREGTQGSSGGPAVRTLPDTAVISASTSVLLLAGIVLLAGSAMVTVAVHSEGSRRR